MGEILNYYKEKLEKKSSAENKDLMTKQRVKNNLIEQCGKYLTESGQALEFEVSSQDLPYITEVILEEPLVSMYNIVQETPTLFLARLKEIEL